MGLNDLNKSYLEENPDDIAMSQRKIPLFYPFETCDMTKNSPREPNMFITLKA